MTANSLSMPSYPCLALLALSTISQISNSNSEEKWINLKDRSSNVSVYVYEDLNFNGRIDRDEEGVSGVTVRLMQDQDIIATRISNIWGFANFTTGAVKGNFDIDSEGVYNFEVIAPNGWEISSEATMQSITYSIYPSSRAGIIGNQMPEPVGITRLPYIKGTISDSIKKKYNQITIHLERNDEVSEKHVISLDSSGSFNARIDSGKWLLSIKNRQGNVVATRRFNMSNYPIHLSPIGYSKTSSPYKKQARIDLDMNRITSRKLAKMPVILGQIKWSNLIVAENDIYGAAGYVNNTTSGDYIAYNSSGYPVSATSDCPFDFHGAYFGLAWPISEGETLELQAWRHDSLVAEDKVTLSALRPVWFDAQWLGITKIELSTTHYWQFTLDDPSFSIGSCDDEDYN